MANTDQIEIQVELRKPGKHMSRGLRQQKRIPAVVYGPKVENVNCWLNENDAVKYSQHRFENTIFVLKSDDSKLNTLKVLKKDISWNPLNRRPVHMDFYAIDMTKKVRVDIEVRFNGRAEGQKEGGVLNIIHRDIEIECLPNEIPEFFEVDITPMQLNDVLHVSDLNIPSSIRVITGAEEAICTVAVPKEEELTPAVAATPDAASATAAAPAAEGGEK